MKADQDFNTAVHDIFERIGRGEKSPHRVSRKMLVDAVEATEERTEDRKEDQADKEG